MDKINNFLAKNAIHVYVLPETDRGVNRGRRGGNRASQGNYRRNNDRIKTGNNNRGKSDNTGNGVVQDGRGGGNNGQRSRGGKRNWKYQSFKLKKQLAKLKKDAEANRLKDPSASIIETNDSTPLTPITETESGDNKTVNEMSVDN